MSANIKPKILARNNLYILLSILAIIILFVYFYRDLIINRTSIFTHDSLQWFGTYYYYLNSLLNGYIPYWNPYTNGGQPFFPCIHILGLLDPLLYIFLIPVKWLNLTILDAFIYHYLLRLVVFFIGAYFLFYKIVGNKIASVIGSLVFLFSIAPASFRQNGFINFSFLLPVVYVFLINFIKKIWENKSGAFSFISFLFCFAILVNIYIPSYLFVNLFIFVFSMVVCKTYEWKKWWNRFKNDLLKNPGIYVFAILIFVALVMPTVVNMYELKNGEYFPSLRMFRDYNKSGSLFIDQKPVVTATILNFAQLVIPYLYEYYFNMKPVMQECFLYIGAVPVVIAFVGVIYGQGKLKIPFLVTMIMMAFLMNTNNYIFDLFFYFFPFFKAISVPIDFMPFFLLNVCIFVAWGIDVLQKSLYGSSRRIQYLFVFFLCSYCMFGITLYFCKYDFCFPCVFLYSALHFLVILLSFFVFYNILLTINISRHIKTYLMVLLISFLTIPDVLIFNHHISPFVLQKRNTLLKIFGKNRKEEFSFYNLVHVPSIYWIPRYSPVLLLKFSAFSNFESHFFCSKLFLNYTTNISPEKQLMISGVKEPKLRYFNNVYRANNSEESLQMINRIAVDDLKNNLVIEKVDSTFLDNHIPCNIAQFSLEKFYENSIIHTYGSNTPRIPSISNKYDTTIKSDELDFNLSDFALKFSDATSIFDIIDIDLSSTFQDKFFLNGLSYIENNNVLLPSTFYNMWEKADKRPLRFLYNDFKRDVSDFFRNDSFVFTANSIQFAITPPGGGYLYYSDGWSKYWHAYVNSKEVLVYRANYAFKAIPLSANSKQEIVFNYDPYLYRYSLYLYFTAVTIMLIIFVVKGYSYFLKG